MRNKESFEERVYELYELKKKKRNATIKRFTLAATTIVAAACIVFVFTRFNHGINNVMPPQTGETLENTTFIENETGAIIQDENNIEEDGMDGMNGIPGNSEDTVAIGCINAITRYPEGEVVTLEKDKGDVLFVRLYNADVELNADYECKEEYYLLEGVQETSELVIYYCEGNVKLQEGDWMKLEEQMKEYMEELIKKNFE